MAQTPFLWSGDGQKLSPKEVERRRALSALAAQRGGDTSPVGHWSQGLARLVDAFGGYRGNVLANKAEKEGQAGAKSVIDALLGGGGGVYGAPSMSSMGGGSPGGTWTPGQAPKATDTPGMEGGGSFGLPAAPAVGGGADLGFGSATMTPQEMIIAGAEARGLNPIDVATAISYETGGTFDPVKAGPTTQWGQHRGLIQFGEPQAQQYGADFSSPEAAMRSQLDPTKGAVWNYLDQTGVQPGMGLDNIYSAINAGAPGRFGASDANNGGAPGTVADKVAGMGDHRAKAAQFLGGTWTPAAGGGNVTMSAQNAPSVGGYAPQGTSPVMQALLQASTDPWVAQEYGPVLQALMGQEQSRQQFAMEQADPMRQLEMQKAQLEIEQMRNPVSTASRLIVGDEARALGLPDGAYNMGADGKVSAIGGGGTTINNQTAPPAGYRNVFNENGQIVSQEPIPGGPADQKIRAEQASQEATSAKGTSNALTATDVVTSSAARAREANDQRVLGGPLGTLASNLPNTANAEVYRQVEVLKSNAKIENLTAMRAASPTGGALGSVTEGESAMLAAKSGALDPASPNFARDLDDYERTLLRVVHGRQEGDAIYEATRVKDKEAEKGQPERGGMLGEDQQVIAAPSINGVSPAPAAILSMTEQELMMLPIEELDEAGLDAMEQRFKQLEDGQ